jgi:hypothetical protein
MTETTFRNRRAVAIENSGMRETVLAEGGHIAEILDKTSGVSPLWTPPWPSIEPSTYSPALHPGYGADSESKLLAGIMGHNLCLDCLAGLRPRKPRAGMTVHGESSVVAYDIAVNGLEMTCRASMPIAGLKFERRIRLSPDGCVAQIQETVENVTAQDKAIAWTQHVTLGAALPGEGGHAVPRHLYALESDRDGFQRRQRLHEDRRRVRLAVRAAPRWRGHGHASLHRCRRFRRIQLALDGPLARTGVLHGLAAFQQGPVRLCLEAERLPWMGIWEENYCRQNPPWNGVSLTRGMEFGVSPVPESRREMIDRGKMFGVPGYRWITAKGRLQADYCAFVTTASKIPEDFLWSGESIKCS